MPREWLKHEDGTVVHINRGRSGKAKTCPFCKRNPVSKLCDFDIGHGKTCDAEMCASCGKTQGRQDVDVGGGFKRLNDTVDYCPIHQGKR